MKPHHQFWHFDGIFVFFIFNFVQIGICSFQTFFLSILYATFLKIPYSQGKFETGTSGSCGLWLSMGKVKLSQL